MSDRIKGMHWKTARDSENGVSVEIFQAGDQHKWFCNVFWVAEERAGMHRESETMREATAVAIKELEGKAQALLAMRDALKERMEK